MSDAEPLLTPASIEWPKRWNKASNDAQIAMIFKHGERITLVTCLGVVHFDLIDDGPHLLKYLEAACDLLRKELS